MNNILKRCWIYWILCWTHDEELVGEDVWLWMDPWEFKRLRRMNRRNIGFDTWLETCRRIHEMMDEDA